MVFNASPNPDRRKTEVRPDPPAPKPAPTAAQPTPQPVAKPVDAPMLPEVEAPPVKVTVKVSPAEEAPAERTFGDSWLSILAVGLSIVALVVALKRKR